MGYVGFDDKWILKHWKEYGRWTDMYEDYKKIYPDIHHSTENFRRHCNIDLHLSRTYTEEQDAWIRNNYPNMGARESYEEFQKTFGIKKGFSGFKSHITDLGLKVTKERKQIADANNGNHEKKPNGSVRKNARGQYFVKRNGKWISMAKDAVGEIPKGHAVVHLDGKQDNNNPDNLAVISRKTLGRMTHNRFWSEDPEITRTGILCCELANALEGNKKGRRT